MGSGLPPPSGEPVGAPVRARTELTRSEFAWTFRALLRATGKGVPWWSTPLLVIALVLGLVLSDGGWFRWILIISGAVGIVITLVLLAMPFVMHLAVPADRRIQEIECSPAGISSGTDDARVSYSWDAVSHVVRGESMLLLVTHRRGEGIAIPHRALTANQRSTLDGLIAAHATHATQTTFR